MSSEHPLDEPSRLKLYRNTLEAALSRLEQAPCRLKVAASRDLWHFKSGDPYHYHSTPEIFFQIGGATRFELPDGEFFLNTGEAAIIPRGVAHCETGFSENEPYRNLVGMFLPDSFSFHEAKLAPDGNVRAEAIDRFYAEDHVELSNLVGSIAAAYQELGDSQQPCIRGLFMAYLAWALSRSGTLDRPPGSEPELIRRCREKVALDLSRSDLTRLTLARQLGCSESHLARSFKEVTGMRLVQYIQNERMARAIELLKTSDLKVACVARECGFLSHSAFGRVFQTHTGQTPMDMRESQRKSSSIGGE